MIAGVGSVHAGRAPVCAPSLVHARRGLRIPRSRRRSAWSGPRRRSPSAVARPPRTLPQRGAVRRARAQQARAHRRGLPRPLRGGVDVPRRRDCGGPLAAPRPEPRKITVVMRAKADGQELARHEEQERWTCSGSAPPAGLRARGAMGGRHQRHGPVHPLLGRSQPQPKSRASCAISSSPIRCWSTTTRIHRHPRTQGGATRESFSSRLKTTACASWARRRRRSVQRRRERALGGAEGGRTRAVRWGGTQRQRAEWETPLEPEVLSFSGSTLVATTARHARHARQISASASRGIWRRKLRRSEALVCRYHHGRTYSQAGRMGPLPIRKGCSLNREVLASRSAL